MLAPIAASGILRANDADKCGNARFGIRTANADAAVIAGVVPTPPTRPARLSPQSRQSRQSPQSPQVGSSGGGSLRAIESLRSTPGDHDLGGAPRDPPLSTAGGRPRPYHLVVRVGVRGTPADTREHPVPRQADPAWCPRCTRQSGCQDPRARYEMLGYVRSLPDID